MKTKRLLIVENDRDCISAMRHALSVACPAVQLSVRRSAPEAIGWLSRHLPDTALISLDHDLGPVEAGIDTYFDPGSGVDVVNYLCERTLVCPILLHTDNFLMRRLLLEKCAEAGWPCSATPAGNGVGWVAQDWIRDVCRLLGI